MRKGTILLLAAAGAAVIALASAQDLLADYEEPDYETLRKDGNIEFRQYPELIAAEIEVAGSGESAANRAFKILAGYIFGKNLSKSKIAMTVPVTESIASEKISMTVPVSAIESNGRMKMQFYMPSKYTLETLPEPIDKRIKFVELPAKKYAVIRFSGFASERNISEKELVLSGYLNDRQVDYDKQSLRAFYNPPWTLPFLRRNEVWYELLDS